MKFDNLAKEYKEHSIFQDLPQYSSFYKSLSDTTFGWISMGTTGAMNMDTYMFVTMQGTLESIREILEKGRINDAYSLVRKYFDCAVLNVYCILYLEDNRSVDNLIVEKIDAWLKGEAQLPTYGQMCKYIDKSKALSSITSLLGRDQRYKQTRDRCNDHTHFNFYYSMLLNDGEIYVEQRVKILNRFAMDVRNVFIMHLAYLFYLNAHYMMSTDHVDSLDAGVKPEEGSERWVAPFIQTIFDSVLKKHRPDIAAAIKANTDMELK